MRYVISKALVSTGEIVEFDVGCIECHETQAVKVEDTPYYYCSNCGVVMEVSAIYQAYVKDPQRGWVLTAALEPVVMPDTKQIYIDELTVPCDSDVQLTELPENAESAVS